MHMRHVHSCHKIEAQGQNSGPSSKRSQWDLDPQSITVFYGLNIVGTQRKAKVISTVVVNICRTISANF